MSLIVVLGTAFHGAVTAWLRLSWEQEHYSHLVLIPFISAYLLYNERKHLFSEVRSAPGIAVVAGLVGLSLCGIGQAFRSLLNQNDFVTISIAGLVTVTVACFIGIWGRTAARRAAFSLSFLYLSVPLPYFLIDHLIEALRRGTAVVVYALFTFVGIPVLRHGYVFVLPRQTIEVARECSGIRSSMALLVLVLLCGHWFLQSNVRRVILFVVTIPLLIFKNALRIVVLTFLATYVDPGFLSGRLHHEGGVVFFALTFAIVAAILHVLRRSERSVGDLHPSSAAASEHA